MILDASSIFKLIRRKKVDPLFDSRTLDFAFYEVGNIIWKHRVLLEKIEEEKQNEYFRMLQNIEEEMVKLKPDRTETMQKAGDLEVTFYDASYIQAAEKTDGKLVTEDGELRKKAGKYVDTGEASELI